MHDYDFSKLNDKEFEAFSIDLLSQHLGVRIERFKAGKDQGVDGRFFCTDRKEVIIQCKHWPKSGVDALIRELKNVEGKKVDILRPRRYLFVTALPLSRKNKSDIQAALTPWIRIPEDIFGQEDLNGLLANYPKIEERHYKLWFSSVTIMSRLQNASIKGRSEFKISDAQAFAPKYVETSSHIEAIQKLETLRTVIITGEPGIGKSTLAEQIALQYILKGFEVCCVAESPSEAEAVWQKDTPQLFYFDDFLGRNYLIALARHEDSHIVGLMKRIGSDPSKRFILTSRTTVLNRGKSLSDLFRIENLDRNEYELKVNHLSLLDKARILYSHIWNSDLNKTYVDEFYRDSRYLQVIKHQNYNPRIISFVTDLHKLQGIPSDKYWEFIHNTLKNPRDIWTHVFDNQLNTTVRVMVRLTVLNSRDISENDLKSAFLRYDLSNSGIEKGDQFNAGIRLAVGSVLNRNVQQGTNSVTFTLFNPSLGDFVVNRYKNDSAEIIACMKALQTVASLQSLKALRLARILEFALYDDVITTLATSFLSDAEIGLSYRIRLAKLTYDHCESDEALPNELIAFMELLSDELADSVDCGIQAELLVGAIQFKILNLDTTDLPAKIHSLLDDSPSEEEFQSISTERCIKNL